MKCQCGYAFYYKASPDNVSVGDVAEEPFLRLNMVATIEREWEPEKRVAILACPACHTLQADI